MHPIPVGGDESKDRTEMAPVCTKGCGVPMACLGNRALSACVWQVYPNIHRKAREMNTRRRLWRLYPRKERDLPASIRNNLRRWIKVCLEIPQIGIALVA